MKELMQKKAAGWFAKGYNCCQSVLLAAQEIFSLAANPELLVNAGHFFREGMLSGCICGALVGAEMALGLINQKKGLDLKPQVAADLHDRFVKTFGSSCCRVVRKKQGVVGRLTGQGCQKVTAVTAGLLYELVEKLRAAPDPDEEVHAHGRG